MSRVRTFMRIGVPCPMLAKRFDYEAPRGWRIVYIYRLDCGWFSVLLERRPWLTRMWEWISKNKRPPASRA
jgi:hypothetical protein